MIVRCLTHFCLAGFLLPALTAQAASHPCAELAEAQARLNCYDQAFPPTATASKPGPTGRSETEVKQEFGLTDRELEARQPVAERDPEVDRISAVVVEIRKPRGHQRVLELDNGQTWKLIEGGTRGPLKRGDSVVIRRAMFGSFLLTTPGGIALRARRVL